MPTQSLNYLNNSGMLFFDFAIWLLTAVLQKMRK